MTRTLHLMLSVNNLAESRSFYETLLGQAPTKVKDDYVQWKIDQPRVNLSLRQAGAHAPGVNHLGIETDQSQDLAVLMAQGQRASATVREEGDTVCCYAHSQKSWVTDPQGLEWELFHTYADSEVDHGPQAEASPCCA